MKKKKFYSNSVDQVASEDMERWRFGLGPFWHTKLLQYYVLFAQDTSIWSTLYL